MYVHDLITSILSYQLVLTSLSGVDEDQVAGEIRAPTKTLKRGAFLAVGSVTILYVLVTLAYVSVMEISLSHVPAKCITSILLVTTKL